MLWPSIYDRHWLAGWLKLTASAFNQVGQYASSLSHKTYCYAELTVSSLVIVRTIASTHCACSWRDGQVELKPPCVLMMYLLWLICSEDLALIRQEIRQVSEQYSIKCLECAELTERLEMHSRAVRDGRRRIHDLLVRWLLHDFDSLIQVKLHTDLLYFRTCCIQSQFNL